MEKFERELKELKNRIIEMGEHSKKMLEMSMEALVKQDVELAEKVIEMRKKLPEFDGEIEDRAFKMIALYQPVAKDLRTLGCILKMTEHLFRIGRYGREIAQIAKELSGRPHVKKLIDLPYVCRITCEMINDALEAFRTENLEKIRDLGERDSVVDEIRHSIFRECLTYMLEDPRNITPCMNYVMIARYLERCADHACEIAEKVYYMVTGERVEID
ncbi:MAG: phosphate signaling complex protein PhoU [Archaeoglobi archaeon]|nr:phosphate signaling complex protein PhoU [Candidatus Mnemosynella sp.]